MLTREQRDKWAEELESGKWKQHHGELRHSGRYCCLGVYAYGVLGTKRKPQGLVTDPQDMHRDLYLDSAILPLEAQRELGKLNDEDKLTFPEIAKHVRELPVSDEPYSAWAKYRPEDAT